MCPTEGSAAEAATDDAKMNPEATAGAEVDAKDEAAGAGVAAMVEGAAAAEEPNAAGDDAPDEENNDASAGDDDEAAAAEAAEAKAALAVVERAEAAERERGRPLRARKRPRFLAEVRDTSRDGMSYEDAPSYPLSVPVV